MEFELFMGCLGNGIICANRAVTENGDYQKICHIAPEGKVTWYVDPGRIPEDAKQKIHMEAQRNYANFEEYFGGLSEVSQFEYLLDRVPHASFMYVLGMKEQSLNEKIAYLRKVIAERSWFPREDGYFGNNETDLVL